MKKTTLIFILASLACVIGAERWHTRHEPLQSDITFYALMGHELLLHRTLYDDLIDHKPPAIFASYAAAEGLMGFGLPSVLFLNIFTALITLLGIYWAAYTPRRSVRAGLWAAAIWTVVCGDLMLEANQPNTEVFLNGCLIWAFALLAQPRKIRWPHILIAGLLLTASTFYWQAALAIVLCLATAHAASGLAQNDQDKITQSLAMATMIAGAWILMTLYFVLTRRWHDFYDLLFAFNRFYATRSGSYLSHALMSFHPAPIPIDVFHGTGLLWGPLVCLCLVGLSLGLTDKTKLFWFQWLAYAMGVQFTIILSANFFSHYYQLWLPLLAVGSGWAIDQIHEKIRSPSVGLTVGLLAIVLLATRELPFYRLSAIEWSTQKYGNEFMVTQKVGEDLRSLLQPEETFYDWGMQNGLYYYSGHLPPTGAFYNYFLMMGPLAERLTVRVMTELQQNPPELFIAIHWVWPGAQFYENHPLYQWAKQYYRRFEWTSHHGSFIFYARRGGALEGRIRRGEVRAHFLDSR